MCRICIFGSHGGCFPLLYLRILRFLFRPLASNVPRRDHSPYMLRHYNCKRRERFVEFVKLCWLICFQLNGLFLGAKHFRLRYGSVLEPEDGSNLGLSIDPWMEYIHTDLHHLGNLLQSKILSRKILSNWKCHDWARCGKEKEAWPAPKYWKLEAFHWLIQRSLAWQWWTFIRRYTVDHAWEDELDEQRPYLKKTVFPLPWKIIQSEMLDIVVPHHTLHQRMVT